MTDATNPYAAPEFSDSSIEVAKPKVRQFDKELAVFAWPLVFVLNMIVPVLLGWGMTRDQGRLGMFAASAVLLSMGWWLCVAKNSLARRMIVGGLLTALSQFIPVLQFGAGLVSVWLADQLGLVKVGFSPQTTWRVRRLFYYVPGRRYPDRLRSRRRPGCRRCVAESVVRWKSCG